MIKNFLKIILSIFIIFTFFWINNSFSANIQNFKYISLTPQTSNDNVKKIQKFFKILKIYKWNIDWKFSSIKPDIVKFQLKNKIIKSAKEDWAGYIWPKTYNFFIDKYWEKFKKAYKNFFEIKEENIKIQKCFIVSAYYSPLPNQKKYSTKSYAWDIRLNWNWKFWASGNWVHPWFIAAPSAYPFETKIQLDWLWVWVVEDRWGAIVRKWVRGHECDRLDIWMWYWDEWLNRALKWGKKKVSGKILDKNAKITISFPNIKREYLAIKIKPESSKKDLKKMQELFLKAKLYSWKIDGKYSSFKKAIINFQIKNKIIQNKNDYAAGYIWPKTIKKLEELYPEIFIIARKEDIEKIKQILKSDKKITKNKKWTIPKKNKKVFSLQEYNKNKILQKYSITNKEKEKLDFIAKKIINILEKKSWKNKKKYLKLKNQLILNISKSVKKSKSIKTKNQLNYLKNIIK